MRDIIDSTKRKRKEKMRYQAREPPYPFNKELAHLDNLIWSNTNLYHSLRRR
ncbi:hypothetical protein [Blautia segnis]|uniref:Uncharacterized protein n=1 Tax=Blautia segnis TaxID=2763030 RepID=A0A8I0AF72_9FIRM|nr:hypothetical protein [Blautia segnis]MBC5649575.1 hypothetical protein [Blautia segnis]